MCGVSFRLKRENTPKSNFTLGPDRENTYAIVKADNILRGVNRDEFHSLISKTKDNVEIMWKYNIYKDKCEKLSDELNEIDSSLSEFIKINDPLGMYSVRVNPAFPHKEYGKINNMMHINKYKTPDMLRHAQFENGLDDHDLNFNIKNEGNRTLLTRIIENINVIFKLSSVDGNLPNKYSFLDIDRINNMINIVKDEECPVDIKKHSFIPKDTQWFEPQPVWNEKRVGSTNYHPGKYSSGYRKAIASELNALGDNSQTIGGTNISKLGVGDEYIKDMENNIGRLRNSNTSPAKFKDYKFSEDRLARIADKFYIPSVRFDSQFEIPGRKLGWEKPNMKKNTAMGNIIDNHTIGDRNVDHHGRRNL